MYNIKIANVSNIQTDYIRNNMNTKCRKLTPWIIFRSSSYHLLQVAYNIFSNCHAHSLTECLYEYYATYYCIKVGDISDAEKMLTDCICYVHVISFFFISVQLSMLCYI